jgi:hypothetical protein
MIGSGAASFYLSVLEIRRVLNKQRHPAPCTGPELEWAL